MTKQSPRKCCTCDVPSLFRKRVGGHSCNASWRGRQILNITCAISQKVSSSNSQGRSQNPEIVTVASHGRHFEIKRAGRKQFNTWFSLTGRPTDNVTLASNSFCVTEHNKACCKNTSWREITNDWLDAAIRKNEICSICPLMLRVLHLQKRKQPLGYRVEDK